MFYALSWSVTLVLLVLWSLAAWAFHSIAAWTLSNAGLLTAGPGTVEGLQAPEWLTPWIPPEFALTVTTLLSASGAAIEAALNQVPALASALSVVVWTVWGVGSALIVVLGLVSGRLIAVLRRRASVSPATFRAPTAAD